MSDRSLVTLARHIAGGERSSLEAVDHVISSIERHEPQLSAVIRIEAERARAEAAARDAERARGELRGPLHGVPIVVKDLQETAGIATSYGLAALRDNVPADDCIMVERLRAAGAVIVAKSNTPALGALGETKNRLQADCRNPWNLECTPGGSSGGSAALVAAGIVPFATGTDSAGSITSPASFCGVFGLKPTHGRIPTWPYPKDAHLLADPGPITLSAEDAALVLNLTAGVDARDPLSVREAPEDYVAAARGARESDAPLAGLRIAYSPRFGHFPTDLEVAAGVAAFAESLAELGAEVEQDDPQVEHPFDLYMPIYITDMLAGTSELDVDWRSELYEENFVEFDRFPPISGAEYVTLLERLWVFRRSIAEFLSTYDLILTPSTASTAFPLGDPPQTLGGEPVNGTWTSFMPFSVAYNLAGLPTASMPAGLTSGGLPIGAMLSGPAGSDGLLLRVAAAAEVHTSWPTATL
ncbi:MAG: amidase [Gaiellales bacterium]|jgi:Asp-tRNA(Asn)/Glu-tRNA(Gln) amidotransferase A subunit family amidase|nr:amidase [Gaiellales bacterium]MEA2467523.1 amidase [Thermoleophilaceae bacterium]